MKNGYQLGKNILIDTLGVRSLMSKRRPTKICCGKRLEAMSKDVKF